MRLAQQKTTIIYVVGFEYSSHASNLYGWVKRERTGDRRVMQNHFQASFMIAISANKIHGVAATTKTYNSKKFIYLLSKLVSNTDEKYALIWDNAKIHISKLVQKFLRDHKLWMITIPAYSPVVNAAEKIILIIKSRIRKYERSGGRVTLQTFSKMNRHNLAVWIEGMSKSKL